MDALPQASDSEPDEEEFVPLPSSSKFTQDAHPTSNKLPTDLFAQAAAEREAQQTAEEDNKRAKASLKAKVRKRKAQIGPKEGSSVLLPSVTHFIGQVQH